MKTKTKPNVPLALLAALALALPLVMGGCGYDEPDANREVIKPVTASQPSQPTQQSSGAAADAPRGGSGQLAYELPEGWEEQPPANPMRLAQARIPGAGGDGGAAGDGEMALFYFGPGGGGGSEANIQRWLGQVEPDAGTEPERDTFESNGLTIHTVKSRGTLTPSPMSMQGGSLEPQPDSMLLGAVVEGPGGPWFFKVTGPAGTIGPQADAFFGMIRNARPR